MNTREFRAAMFIADVTSQRLAEKWGVTVQTARKKINGTATMTVKEADAAMEILNLTPEEAGKIFFG